MCNIFKKQSMPEIKQAAPPPTTQANGDVSGDVMAVKEKRRKRGFESTILSQATGKNTLGG